MSQLFGYQVLRGPTGATDPKFDGMQPVLTATHFKSSTGQVKLFSTPGTLVPSWFSAEHRAYVFIWGNPVHPELSGDGLLEWCMKIIAEERYECFKDLLGAFVILIDEPEHHRLTVVTDILGVRPMFLTNQDGRIVFGSDVWSLQEAGVGNGTINYDAVSAWIVYGFNCTDQSLFSDLRRLAAGAVNIFRDGQETEFSYANFESSSQILPADQIVEDIHGIVSSTVQILLSKHPKVSFALSGGYDSRYLLALSSSLTRTSLECCTVSFTKEEEWLSQQVAESLGLPLKKIPVGSSIWNLYDNVYHFAGDGFPISKFVTYCVAQQSAGVPMVNGFMGDSLIRGSKDTYLGKSEEAWAGNLVDVLQRKHMITNCHGFRSEMAKRIIARSRVPMEHAVKKGASLGKVFAWTDFYYRQRYYISNNFLQHLHLSDALLPFYSWELLAYKMGHAYSVFTPEVYQQIFKRYFPRLSIIPRTSDAPAIENKVFGVAQCTKQWAREILPCFCTNQRLSLLEKKRCIQLMLAGMIGMRKAESSVFLFKRLHLLEETSRHFGIDFDWDAI